MRFVFPSVLFACALVVSACDDASHCYDCGGFPVPSPYAFPTAPESLITNLQVSYRYRDIERYAQILAPEFTFHFQPVDANQIGTQFWTRDQDSTGTRALLTTTQVSEIRINLVYVIRDSTVNLTPPVDSLKIRVKPNSLEVDQTDGITWVVVDQQDMYFRKGKPENGEDPTHWLMYRWVDSPLSSASVEPQAGGPTTWGKLKTLYNLRVNR